MKFKGFRVDNEASKVYSHLTKRNEPIYVCDKNLNLVCNGLRLRTYAQMQRIKYFCECRLEQRKLDLERVSNRCLAMEFIYDAFTLENIDIVMNHIKGIHFWHHINLRVQTPYCLEEQLWYIAQKENTNLKE